MEAIALAYHRKRIIHTKPRQPESELASRRTKVFSRGLNWFVPKEKLVTCYDCGWREVTLIFSAVDDRYIGRRICKVCIQSFKRKSGSFLAD